MKVAVLSPIAWRTPPLKYGPWEKVASHIAEGLVSRGHDVTLFATANSQTAGRLFATIEKPYEEDKEIDPKVAECLHISALMERADEFDIIHNHFDFLPLTYSKLIKTPMITTIHGFSSDKILPVYEKYNEHTHYISISDADRNKILNYLTTIYHGLPPEEFQLGLTKKDYLLYFGRLHYDKGAHTAIQIAKKCHKKLLIAGLIQDETYYNTHILPHIDDETVVYCGNVGKEKRNSLLSEASALLHPIYFDEPFGLSVVEAMMCGTPTIAFNRGSMPELITDKTGFLVATEEEAIAAVDKLSTIDPAACRQEAINKFGLDKMIDNYLNAYQEILS